VKVKDGQFEWLIRNRIQQGLIGCRRQMQFALFSIDLA
jgi:hypothetical protein